MFSGDFGQAISEYQATLRPAAAHRKTFDLTGSSDTLAVSAMIAAKRGRTDEALRMVGRLIDGVNRGEQGAYDVATIFALLGRMEEAFQWLDRAIKQREGPLRDLKQDPFLVTLRSDPRFAALLQRIGLPISASAATR